METTARTDTCLPLAAEPSTRGPVPLDASLLGLVAGGVAMDLSMDCQAATIPEDIESPHGRW